MGCCTRNGRPIKKDFCSQLRISASAKIAQVEGEWVLLVSYAGAEEEITKAITKHACPDSNSGVKLARSLALCLSKAVEKGNTEELKFKMGRQMPLILMREMLLRAAGKCTACNARKSDCAICEGTGIEP